MFQGFLCRKGLLLTGERVTTYRWYHYYLRSKGLLLTGNMFVCRTDFHL